MIDWDATVLQPLEDVFAEPATYLPAVGDEFQISGVFDESYREVDLAGGMAVTSDKPVLGVRLSQFTIPPKQGDQVTMASLGNTYDIKEVRPDSHGWALLMLNLAYQP